MTILISREHKYTVGDIVKSVSSWAIVRKITFKDGGFIASKDCISCPNAQRCCVTSSFPDKPLYWGLYGEKNELKDTIGKYRIGASLCCYTEENCITLVDKKTVNLDRLKELCKGDKKLFNEIKELL